MGCQQADQNPAQQAIEIPQPGLVLAVPPYEMPSRIQQRFEPLVDYLSTVLGQPVQLHITHSYEDQIKRLALGEFDLAYMGPSSYVKAKNNFKQSQGEIQLIAAEAPYRAAIIVHRDSPIQTLPDLKHHSIAFGSYHSYSGHFIVRQLLRLEQVFLRDLQFYSFLGRHERAIMSVVHQEFDAAATTEGLAQRFIDMGHPIRILKTSEFLAPTVLVGSAQLDPQHRELLIEALLFNQDTQHEFAFFEVDQLEFETVNRILHALEK